MRYKFQYKKIENDKLKKKIEIRHLKNFPRKSAYFTFKKFFSCIGREFKSIGQNVVKSGIQNKL